MTKSKITTLPLGEADRTACIQCANQVFESVLARMEPPNVEAIRSLWNAESYVATFLTDDMLPIDRDYALGLIDALLVHHVVDLAAEADAPETIRRH